MSNNDSQNKERTNIVSNHTLEIKLEEAKKAKASLRQMTGKFIGRKYPLNVGSNIVGRDPGLDLTIQDSSVSRRHAELVFDGKELQVVDRESTNGTFVNDKQIKTSVIKAGDLIRFGNVVFKYSAPGDIESVFQDDLSNLAHMDGLTGIYNRKYIVEYLDSEIRRCVQLGLPVSLIIFDLDHFKKVNDTYGHLAGDYVLKETARALKEEVLRATDIFGRYGGEEFCIILSETPAVKAKDIAERVRLSVFKHEFFFDGNKIPVTISLGVAETGKFVTDSTKLISEADSLLYKAKQSGRNQVCS